MIKIILKENVAGVGRSGDVKQVKDGFARNFLLPRKLALPATENNLRRIETEIKKKENQKSKERQGAEELAAKLNQISVTVAAEVNEDGKLYGGLAVSDVVAAVAAEGIELDKKNIFFETPIREPGIYDVEVKLHPEVSAKIKVWVVKK